MLRAVQSWAPIGGLLGATIVIGGSAIGCNLFAPRSYGQVDIGVNEGETTDTSSSSTGSTGAGASTAGAGGGYTESPDPCENSTKCLTQEKALEGPNFITSVEYITGELGGVGVENGSVFKLKTTDASLVRIETFDKPGGGCAGLDTILRWERLGPPLEHLNEEDRNGMSECAALSLLLSDNTDYALTVFTRNKAFESAEYAVKFTAIPLTKVSAIDTTDPNDFSSVEPIALEFDKTNNKSAVWSTVGHGNYEFFSFTANGPFRAEIVEYDPKVRCENSLDLSLLLYDKEGNLIMEDDDSGRGDCPLIDGFGTAPVHPKAHAAQGTVYLGVTNTKIEPANYTLIVELQ